MKIVNDFINKFFKQGKTEKANDFSNESIGVDQIIGNRDSVSARLASNKKVRSKQQNTMLVVLLGILVALFGFIKLMQTKKEQKIQVSDRDKPIKIEVASDNASAYEMMYKDNKKEHKDTALKLDNAIKRIEEQAALREKSILDDTKIEISKLSEQLSFIAAELRSTNSKLESTEKELFEAKANANEPKASSSEVSIRNLGSEVEYFVPKSTKYYIPETTFFSGNILEGISASTSDGAMQNPTKLTIKVTDNGDLSPNFAISFRSWNCKVEASAYGIASSQRINIRLEKLVCTDPKTQLITTTEILGNVTGPDGKNGIKGTVVDTSITQMRNAAAAGFLNGFVNAAKNQQSTTITPLGSINTKKQGFGDILKDSSINGASSGLDELAKYYIKKADSLSSVIETPGAVRVQMHIRKGVFFGQVGIRKKVKQLRQENLEQQREEQWGNENE